ncbi:MAG: hypothetical protein WCP28_07425 [Actinomycetes bacterium]
MAESSPAAGSGRVRQSGDGLREQHMALANERPSALSASGRNATTSFSWDTRRAAHVFIKSQKTPGW